MRRRQWRFHETTSGAKPVQAFLDNRTANSRPTQTSSPKATQPPQSRYPGVEEPKPRTLNPMDAPAKKGPARPSPCRCPDIRELRRRGPRCPDIRESPRRGAGLSCPDIRESHRPAAPAPVSPKLRYGSEGTRAFVAQRARANAQCPPPSADNPSMPSSETKPAPARPDNGRMLPSP
jgi:hypothetical protein